MENVGDHYRFMSYVACLGTVLLNFPYKVVFGGGWAETITVCCLSSDSPVIRKRTFCRIFFNYFIEIFRKLWCGLKYHIYTNCITVGNEIVCSITHCQTLSVNIKYILKNLSCIDKYYWHTFHFRVDLTHQWLLLKLKFSLRNHYRTGTRRQNSALESTTKIIHCVICQYLR